MVRPMSKQSLWTIIAISAFFSASANAEYIATGPIKGQFCKWVVFDICSFKEVDSFLQDGNIVRLSGRFRDVDKYSPSKGRCWIETGGVGFGRLFSLSGLEFFYRGKNLGTPHTISFKCKKLK